MLKQKCFLVMCLLGIAFLNVSNADNSGKQVMAAQQICQQTPLKKSQELIRFILNDITETYTQVGGGGITGIKLVSTDTFVVSVSQEERIDKISYELSVDGKCNIKIIKREVTAVTPWQK